MNTYTHLQANVNFNKCRSMVSKTTTNYVSCERKHNYNLKKHRSLLEGNWISAWLTRMKSFVPRMPEQQQQQQQKAPDWYSIHEYNYKRPSQLSSVTYVDIFLVPCNNNLHHNKSPQKWCWPVGSDTGSWLIGGPHTCINDGRRNVFIVPLENVYSVQQYQSFSKCGQVLS